MPPKQKIIIDFRTKIVSEDAKIWILFPGEGYKFQNAIYEKNIIFGDFPGMDLAAFDIEDDESLKKWLAISENIKSFWGDTTNTRQVPSRNPEDYSNYTWTGKRLNSKGVFRGLFSRAKKGDLVLVTGKGGAFSDTNIWEIENNPDIITYTTFQKYGDERIPGRRVKWLGKIQNRSVSEEFYNNLISPNAFTLLGRKHHGTVLAQAYENYFRADTATSLFDIRSEEFSTVPDFYLKLIANVAGEISRGIENDNLDKFMQQSIVDWMTNFHSDEHFAIQKIQINSPGTNFLQSVKITPILAAVLLSLFQYSPLEIQASELVFINSVNDEAVLDECDIPVAEAVKQAAELMSLDKLEIMCRAAKQAKELGEIETPITTRKEN